MRLLILPLAATHFPVISYETLVLDQVNNLSLISLNIFITCLLDDVWQGVKLTFFSDSHMAPKFFKVVANSKKVGRHFQRQTKSFFTLSAF